MSISKIVSNYIVSSWVLLLFFSLSNSLFAATVQLEGEVTSTVILEISTQNQTLSNQGISAGILDFGNVNSLGTYTNPIGRTVYSEANQEAYYQTDLRVSIRASGLTSTAGLVVKQIGSGPLQNYVYDADANFDINQTRSLSPIPLDPNKKVIVSNLSSGDYSFSRQLILRVPANLPEGSKSALVQYDVEVCQ